MSKSKKEPNAVYIAKVIASARYPTSNLQSLPGKPSGVKVPRIIRGLNALDQVIVELEEEFHSLSNFLEPIRTGGEQPKEPSVPRNPGKTSKISERIERVCERLVGLYAEVGYIKSDLEI